MRHLDHYVYMRGRAFQRTGVKAVIQIWRGVYPTNPRPLMMRGRQFISDAFDVEMINLWAASLGLSNRPLLELPSCGMYIQHRLNCVPYMLAFSRPPMVATTGLVLVYFLGPSLLEYPWWLQ